MNIKVFTRNTLFAIIATSLPFTPSLATAAQTNIAPLGIKTSSSFDSNHQYIKEVSLNPCSWTDRPIGNSTCFTYKDGFTQKVPCDAPTHPIPIAAFFNLTASTPCVIDPYVGCHRQKWHWSDGRMVGGHSYNELRCPTNPAHWGLHFSLPLATHQSGDVFIQLPAFFVHLTPKVVRAQAKLRAYSSVPWEPFNMPPQPMTAILALQRRHENGAWLDVASMTIHTPTQYTPEHNLYEIEAMISPFTEIRLELRAGSVPAPISTKDNEYYRNYHLTVDVVSASLLLPECIPDEATGTCL